MPWSMAPETAKAATLRGRRRVCTMRLSVEPSGRKSSRQTSAKGMSLAPTETESEKASSNSPRASGKASQAARALREGRAVVMARCRAAACGA